MPGRIDARLKDLGIVLPQVAKPVANYVPWVVTGNLVFVSGQVTFKDGKLEWLGKVGREYSIEQGAQAARQVGLNILAALKGAVGDLDRIARIVKLVGFVNAPPEFTDHPKVINGCSDLMVEVFGEKGKHTRVALGAAALPANCAVEIDCIAEIAAPARAASRPAARKVAKKVAKKAAAPKRKAAKASKPKAARRKR
ncbi:MAG: RidA family protein [Alphaproteobacteria bacterium]|nr:RidA family protein [Alphaproteobacteria bacterium]